MSRYTKILDGANITDIEEGVTYSYFLYVRPDSSWIILRQKADETEYRYATGAGDIDTAWTNRASQNYKRANEFIY